MRVVGTTTPPGGASISGRRRSPVRRHNNAIQQGEEKLQRKLRKKKGPFRVSLTGRPFYTTPGEDDPSCGLDQGLVPQPGLFFFTGW
jgi:hypothetical protein